MARWTVGTGLTEYMALLGDLQYKAPAVCGMAIYDGAKIVADAIREAIENLPTTDERKIPRDPSPKEVKGLEEGLGIAKLQRGTSFINVKIGMDGYNDDVTPNYPRGHPNALIARSINAGSSVAKRNPFIDRAVRATRKQAEAAMKTRVDRETEKIMNK